MNSSMTKFAICLLLSLLLLPAILPAQPGTAVLRGQVLDQTGALIPGAGGLPALTESNGWPVRIKALARLAGYADSPITEVSFVRPTA